MQAVYNDRLKSIIVDIEDVKYNRPYVYSDGNRDALLDWLKRISELDSVSDREFYDLKVDIENWYEKIGGNEIRFIYRDEYLLKPAEAAKRLGISLKSLDDIVNNEMEYVLPDYPFKVPKHAVDAWKKQNDS